MAAAASYYLGLDLGTQSAKAVLCTTVDSNAHTISSKHQTILAVGHSKEIRMICDASSDLAEQDPSRWISAVKEACHDLMESYSSLYAQPLDANRIRSVAVSGHQHGLVLLDENDEIVRPCMMWCDTRAAAEAKELSDYANITYPAGYTAPKIMWLKKNEPENYHRTVKIMLPHDYLNYHLSGGAVHAMERGDCSGMGGILSLGSNSLNTELMHFISPDLASKLPVAIADPHTAIGSVHEDIWQGLFPGEHLTSGESAGDSGRHVVLLAPGCGDNAMSTLAITSLVSASTEVSCPSAASPLILSLGTSGTLCSVSPSPLIDLSGGIAPFCDSTGNYLPLICIQNCSLVPEEVRKTFPHLSRDAITALAAQEPPGCEGVLLLPYFSEGGERTPNWPGATGCFLGLRQGHLQRPGLLYRAALESVAFALLRGHRRMVQHGLPALLPDGDSKISLVGGGLNNLLWRQIIADVFQATVEVHDPQVTTKASAVGAALQAAAVALGVPVGQVPLVLTEGSVQAVCYHPTRDTEMNKVYDAAFQRHVSISNSLFGGE